MKNKIEDLNNHLFAQIEKFSDDTQELTEEDYKRAGVISDLSATLIESARTEVMAAKVMHEASSDGLVSALFKNKSPAAIPAINGTHKSLT